MSGRSKADDLLLAADHDVGVCCDADIRRKPSDCGRRPAALATLAALSIASTGALGAAFYEDDGTASMDVENCTSNDRWREEADGRASGGRYMTATSKRGKNDRLQFRISFATVGWYRVWIRCKSTSHADNDCYVTLDGESGSVPVGGAWKKVAGIKTNHTEWGWDSQAKEEGMPLRERLKGCHVYVGTFGTHVLALGSRSREFKVDKVVLLHLGHPQVAARPKGTGPEETVASFVFPEDAAGTPKMRAAERLMREGRVGAGMRLAESLASSGAAEPEKESAGRVLSAVKAWLQARRDRTEKLLDAGNAIVAYQDAADAARALAGHPAREEFRKAAEETRRTREFDAGMRFVRLLQALAGAPAEARSKALARFAESRPDSYYGRAAKSLLEQP